jgi:hypothetical protein
MAQVADVTLPTQSPLAHQQLAQQPLQSRGLPGFRSPAPRQPPGSSLRLFRTIAPASNPSTPLLNVPCRSWSPSGAHGISSFVGRAVRGLNADASTSQRVDDIAKLGDCYAPLVLRDSSTLGAT